MKFLKRYAKQSLISFNLDCFSKSAGGSSLDWMYKGDRPDDEEYLLGKKIDKYIEGENDSQDDTNTGLIPCFIM